MGKRGNTTKVAPNTSCATFMSAYVHFLQKIRRNKVFESSVYRTNNSNMMSNNELLHDPQHKWNRFSDRVSAQGEG